MGNATLKNTTLNKATLNKPDLTPTGRPTKASKLFTFKELIEATAASSGYAKYEVKDVATHLLWQITEALKNQKLPVELKGFGLMKRSVWSARKQFSQLTKTTVELPERISASFAPSVQLRNYLNGWYDEAEDTENEDDELEGE